MSIRKKIVKVLILAAVKIKKSKQKKS